MEKFIKGITIVLVVTMFHLFSALTSYAVQDREFVVEQSPGYTQSFTITNLVEAKENFSTDSYIADYYVKVLSPSKIHFDCIFSTIKLQYNDEEYSDESENSISSIVKEYGKVIIPDGSILPQHYDVGYELEFEQPGQYFLKIEHLDYGLGLLIDVIEGSQESIEQVEITEVTALPTLSKVIVDGKEVAFEAYTINGYNYFKLRDIAISIRETNKRFEVIWDNNIQAINLISGLTYTEVGGELQVGDGTIQTGVLNHAPIYKDGEKIEITAYTINGNNFFKLRDLAKVFNFGVTWDETTGTIGIDTSIEYTE